MNPKKFLFQAKLEDILSNSEALNSLKGELGINEETK